MVPIEDHTFQTAVVFVAAAACVYASLVSPRESSGSWRRLATPATFWFLFGSTLFVLAIAKTIGLQQLVGSHVRELAREDGLYDSRRPYQRLANYAVVALAFATFGSGVVIWVKRWFVLILPLFVVVTLLAFTGIRAISLHNVDTLFYRTDLWGIRVGALVEVTLTASIGALALLIGVLMHGQQSHEGSLDKQQS